MKPNKAKFSHFYFESLDKRYPNIGRGQHVIPEKYAGILEEEWLKVFDRDPSADPYGKFPVDQLVINSVGRDGELVCDFCLDRSYRYHFANGTIPATAVRRIVSFPEWSKYDYIIVDNEWHDDFWAGQLSGYAMIDLIGTKKALNTDPLKFKRNLKTLMRRIDKIAKHYPEIVFMTFADSILLKINFPMIKADRYKPEILLKCFTAIEQEVNAVLKMEVYAVFTQGLNYLGEKNLFHQSEQKNHFGMMVLGSSFAELIKLEAAAVQNVKAGIHNAGKAYLSKFFYYSLSVNGERKKAMPRDQIEKLGYAVDDPHGLLDDLRDLPEEYGISPYVTNRKK